MLQVGTQTKKDRPLIHFLGRNGGGFDAVGGDRVPHGDGAKSFDGCVDHHVSCGCSEVLTTILHRQLLP